MFHFDGGKHLQFHQVRNDYLPTKFHLSPFIFICMLYYVYGYHFCTTRPAIWYQYLYLYQTPIYVHIIYIYIHFIHTLYVRIQYILCIHSFIKPLSSFTGTIGRRRLRWLKWLSYMKNVVYGIAEVNPYIEWLWKEV